MKKEAKAEQPLIVDQTQTSQKLHHKSEMTERDHGLRTCERMQMPHQLPAFAEALPKNLPGPFESQSRRMKDNPPELDPVQITDKVVVFSRMRLDDKVAHADHC